MDFFVNVLYDDLASAPGAPKGDGANDLETLNKCLSNEAPNIQVGVYQDRFIPTGEDNQLSVRSDSDGGLSTVVALNLVGICPEELVTITLSIERDNNLIATTSFDYFEGFCTTELHGSCHKWEYLSYQVSVYLT